MLPPSPLPPLRLSTPPLAVRVDGAVTLSTVARLVASGAAQSKADLVPASGMARTTVSAAVDELLARGVLRVAGTRPPRGGAGRPTGWRCPRAVATCCWPTWARAARTWLCST